MTSNAYPLSTVANTANAPTSTRQRPGARRANATAPANAARYARAWLAPCQESSGCTDQVIETAVSTASAANSETVTAPQARPGALNSTTAAHSAAPSNVSTISAHVVGARSTPPVVVKARRAKPAARPSPSVASLLRRMRGARWRAAAGAGPDASRSGAVTRDDTAPSLAIGPGLAAGAGNQHQRVTKHGSPRPGTQGVERLQ